VSRDQIAELVHEYSDAVIHRDEARWASCWTEDATWTLPRGRHVEGRDAIVELWRTAMAAYASVVQFVHDGHVAVDGDRGSGRWHVGEHACRTNGEPSILLATYEDTYARAHGAWRFRSRSLVVHYQGPPDLSGSFG
jgi:uncharacterized protein (TIGR02246 family)